VTKTIQEAPASFKDCGGRGVPIPQPPKLSQPSCNPIDTQQQNLTYISIPAVHFDNFEQSINEVNGTALISHDCITNVDVTSADDQQGRLASSPHTRSDLPKLVNTDVRVMCEPMEVDSGPDVLRRKRTMSHASSVRKQSGIKAKIVVSEVSNIPRDSPLSSNPEKILYSSTDNSPYIVHVHSVNEDSLNPTHPLLISQSLSRIAYADIKEIRKIGRGKVLAEMHSAKAANNLVLNPNLEKENLKAFIPVYRTIRSGIVKDIPQHYDENDLLEFFDSLFKVVEVKRLNRRIRIKGEMKYIPSRTVCLKFVGQILPKYVFLCHTRHEVYPFVPKIKICYSCFRVGHVSKANLAAFSVEKIHTIPMLFALK